MRETFGLAPRKTFGRSARTRVIQRLGEHWIVFGEQRASDGVVGVSRDDQVVNRQR